MMGFHVCKLPNTADYRFCVSLKIESLFGSKNKVYWQVSLMSKDGSKYRMKEGKTLCKRHETIESFKVSKNLILSKNFRDVLQNEPLIICLELVALDVSECQSFWKNFQGLF